PTDRVRMPPIAPPADGSEIIGLINYTNIRQFIYKHLITCIIPEKLINSLTQIHSTSSLNYIFTNQINPYYHAYSETGARLPHRAQPGNITYRAMVVCIVFLRGKLPPGY